MPIMNQKDGNASAAVPSLILNNIICILLLSSKALACTYKTSKLKIGSRFYFVCWEFRAAKDQHSWMVELFRRAQNIRNLRTLLYLCLQKIKKIKAYDKLVGTRQAGHPKNSVYPVLCTSLDICYVLSQSPNYQNAISDRFYDTQEYNMYASVIPYIYIEG